MSKLNPSIAEKAGYTTQHFRKWGKLGGRPRKYLNRNEMLKVIRRKRILAELSSGKRIGFLNTLTGRVNKPKKRK